MPIIHARERLVIAQLVIAISRAFARSYYPGTGLARSIELQLVAMAVFIGHAEDRPMSASAVARFVELPRPTVLRRLQALIKARYVVRKGRYYCMNVDAINGAIPAAITRENIRRIIAAAKELSNLDENR